jgi:SAM-dependent methyltransferase
MNAEQTISHLTDRPEYGDEPRRPLLRLVPADARRILDIGCNRGAFGAAIKLRQEAEVWGIEPDASCASVARERLDHVINDTLNSTNPTPNRYFDLITFNDSLEHMADPVMALELCKEKLCPGGRVQCCVPNMRNVENLEHLLFERDWRYEDRGVRDRTHLRFFTEKSIVRLFEDLGYEIEKTCGINNNWWNADKRMRRLFFRLFPAYTRDMRSLQIVVTAKFSNL